MGCKWDVKMEGRRKWRLGFWLGRVYGFVRKEKLGLGAFKVAQPSRCSVMDITLTTLFLCFPRLLLKLSHCSVKLLENLQFGLYIYPLDLMLSVEISCHSMNWLMTTQRATKISYLNM